MAQGEIFPVNKMLRPWAGKEKRDETRADAPSETEGFLLPVQQGGHAFFLVFGDGFQRGAGNQERTFDAQFFRFFVPYFAETVQIGFKLFGMLAALDVGRHG